MRKTLTVMTLVMALLVSTMSMALANADKAMGSIEDEIRTFEYVAHGTWTNKGGKELAAKGHATLTNLTNGNYWTMDVDAVSLSEGKACFIGPVVDGNVIQGTWQRVVVEDGKVYTQHTTGGEGAALEWFHADCQPLTQQLDAIEGTTKIIEGNENSTG
jgi:hypothetical protein